MNKERILIVDDDQSTGNIVSSQLASLGYSNVSIVHNGEQACQFTHQYKPDLVLMDINLGAGMDGIETAEKIMQSQEIPIIYITAYADEETLSRAKKTQPYGYINKPLRENDIRTTVTIAFDQILNDRLIFEEPFNNSLKEVLDRLTTGIVFVNENLKVFYTNKSVENIFSEGHDLNIVDGNLICSSAAMTAELHKLVLEESVKLLTITRKQASKPQYVLVSPLNSQTENYGRDLPISIIYIFQTINCTDRIHDVIRVLYKLSPTEAKIAARLVMTPHIEEVANAMGITYNTVRTHLKRIYIKTGARNISSLVHMVLTGPVGFLVNSSE